MREAQESPGPGPLRRSQDQKKRRKYRGRRRLVFLSVALGLICMFLLIFIVVLLLRSTAERELMKNTVKELNLTITSLSQKNQELGGELREVYSKPGFIFLTPELKSWSESRQFCRDNGADLVMIKTEEKQSFISSRVNERVWIGLSDADEEGKWKWVDNSPLNQGFWIKGEPNNYLGEDEDCAEIRPINNNKLWNDIMCSFENRGVCEKAVK
ncbi:hypothetical protein DNTS_031444 [Danionella cerebrum]|uniref:C-type lectin domain-containing protein n=1 Tax=Danionella cerebrum TaxID=2873325 RepID=A0A553QQ66_9TELE|nr:hypothetical protein DNTS_031444 [Danionella translucida]